MQALTLPPMLASSSPPLAAFLFLLLFGYIFPIPEELALVIAGGMLRAAGFAFPLALPIAVIALSLADTGFYLIARLLGPGISRLGFLSRLFAPEKFGSIRNYYLSKGTRIVFACRFVPGLRMASILGSGFLKLPLHRFLAFDASAITIAASAWLGIGFMIGRQFGTEATTLGHVLAAIAPLALITGVVLVGTRVKADMARLQSHQA